MKRLIILLAVAPMMRGAVVNASQEFHFIYNNVDMSVSQSGQPPARPVVEVTESTSVPVATPWRRRSIGLSIGVLYMCSFYVIQRAQWLMSDSTAWLNWNAALPLEQLLTQPHGQIYAALKQAIETRCQSPSLPIMVNVTQFLTQTNAELACLRLYVRVCGWLEKIPLATRLCLVEQNGVRQAQDSIKRLVYLRSVLAQELEPQNTLRRINLVNYQG